MNRIKLINTSMAFEKIHKSEYQVRLNQFEAKVIDPLSNWGLSAITLKLSDGRNFFFEKLPAKPGWSLPKYDGPTEHKTFTQFEEIADELIQICNGNILVIDEELTNKEYLEENFIAREFNEYTKNNSIESRIFFEHAVLNFEFSRAKKNFQASIISEQFFENNLNENPFDEKDIREKVLSNKQLNIEAIDTRIEGTKNFFKELYKNDLVSVLPIHWKIQDTLYGKKLSKSEKLVIAEEIVNEKSFEVCKIYNSEKKKWEIISTDNKKFLELIPKIAREPKEYFENLCDQNFKSAITHPTGYDHIGRGGWKNLYAYLFRILIDPKVLLNELGSDLDEKTKLVLLNQNDGYQAFKLINTADAFFYSENTIFDQTYTNKKFVKNQNRPLALIVNPNENITEENVDRLKLQLENNLNSLKKSCVPYALLAVPLYESQEEIISNLANQIKTCLFFLGEHNPNYMEMDIKNIIEWIKRKQEKNPFFYLNESDESIEEKITLNEFLFNKDLTKQEIDHLKEQARLSKIIIRRFLTDFNPTSQNERKQNLIAESQIQNFQGFSINEKETSATMGDSLPLLISKLIGIKDLKLLLNHVNDPSENELKKMVEPMSLIFNDKDEPTKKLSLMIPMNNKLEEVTVKQSLRALLARVYLFNNGEPRNTLIKVGRMIGSFDDLIAKIDKENINEIDKRKAERTLEARVSELLQKSFTFLFQAIDGNYFSTDKNYSYSFNSVQKEIILKHININLKNLLNKKSFVPHPFLFEFH